MGKIKKAMDAFTQNYETLCDHHRAYIKPVLDSRDDRQDIYGAKNIHIILTDKHPELCAKVNPNHAPYYPDMTLPMMYSHYWGNAPLHYYDGMFDLALAATYHVMGGMDGSEILLPNPYGHYDALHAGLGEMKKRITRKTVAQKFTEQQNHIVNIVRSDRDLYMAAMDETGFSKGNREAFDSFWRRSAYYPHQQNILQQMCG